MPISKYNPDGTVDIYNKKTGEVKTGINPSELGTISPNLVAEYQQGQSAEATLARTEAEQKLEAIRSGEGEPDPLKPQKRVAEEALDILQSRFGRGAKENLGTKEDLSLAGEGGLLSRTFGKAKVAMSGVVAGELQQDVNKYKNALNTFRGVFTQAFGSGTPQEAEAKALIEAAPGPGSTNAEATAWFDDVKTLLGGKKAPDLTQEALDQETGKKKIVGDEKELAGQVIGEEEQVTPEKPKRNPVVNFFLGAALNLAQDVGVGLGLQGEEGRGLQQSQDQAIEMANRAFDKSLTIDDPEQKRKLQQVANDTLQQVGFSAENIQELFSESIEEPTLQRAALAAIDVAGTAEIPGMIKGIGKKLLTKKGGMEVTEEAVEQATKRDIKGKVVKVGEKIESLSPRKILGEAQTKAAELYKGVKPQVDEFVKIGKELAEQDPDIAKEFVKQKGFLSKIDSIPNLLKRMETWGRTTYLKGGGIKSSAKAALYDDLYKEGLRQLKELAPEVYKNRSLLRFSFELPKAAGRLLWKATLGRIATGL